MSVWDIIDRNSEKIEAALASLAAKHQAVLEQVTRLESQVAQLQATVGKLWPYTILTPPALPKPGMVLATPEVIHAVLYVGKCPGGCDICTPKKDETE